MEEYFVERNCAPLTDAESNELLQIAR